MQDTLELGMSPDSPGLARHFVADHMRLWGHESLIHDAMLMTSEVVTNAVTHAAPPVELTVEHLQGGVVVLVADGAHGPAELQSSGGRGLRIVDMLASAWGVSQVPNDGKVVWFRLAPSR